jgi:RNA polymerase sigma-70 factor, ECF subfamily
VRPFGRLANRNEPTRRFERLYCETCEHDLTVDHTPERALDEYLVSLSQSGSSEALDGLARRWTPRLLRYAARLLGGRDSAEAARDVVQETWIGAIRGLRGLRDPAQFPAWIYGIATRKCADAIRANIRRRRLDWEAAGESSRTVENLTSDSQIDLANGIRRLPPIHRAVVHLLYREELSVDEIAAVLGIPAGTVKSRLHHARDTLKRQLSATPVRIEGALRKQEIS